MTGYRGKHMGKLISVIIPIYNVEPYLCQCIDSILRQTYKNLEILLIDDGSTDSCYEICEKYVFADMRIRVIHKQNEGLVSARKTGVMHARGEYVLCVDGDDWIEPDYIEELVKVQKRTQAEMIAVDLYFDIGDSSKVIRNGCQYGVYDGEKLYHNLLYNGQFFEYGINPHLVTKLISRELLRPIQMAVDERIMAGEDAAVTYPCVLTADRVCIADVCGYHYVQHLGSMTKTKSTGEEKRAQILFQYLEKSFENAGYKEPFVFQLNQYKKYFMLLRMIERLDRPKAADVLSPFGGIKKGSRVVLYGAGGLGQSIFRYLDADKRAEIVLWLDRSYHIYRSNGMRVDEPERIIRTEVPYDYVIIANVSGAVAKVIRQGLIRMGVAPEKIRWLSEDFLCEDVSLEAKEMILFGCGNIGYEALYSLGEENVKCFCDNNPSALRKGEGKTKDVVSFETLIGEYNDQIVVLCAVDEKVVCDMAIQCEENGIHDYVAYMSARRNAVGKGTTLAYISDPANRIRERWVLWKHRIETLEKQLEYFRRHADIRYMKPAEGRLREWQLQCVHAAAAVLKQVEKLGINPFLIGGNLIGYVRHNGFVPWDDDMDFGLIRSEYEKLKNYCRENLYTYEEYREKEKTGIVRKGIVGSMEDFCWACYPSNFVVFYQEISVDFFVLDYYSEEIPFSDMRSVASEMRKEMNTRSSLKEKNQYLETVRADNKLKTVEKSNRIYFGIDNIEIENKYHKGSYIPEDVIFPLREVVWEGERFYIPNDTEAFLEYEFDDIWEFPKDIGIPKHFEILGIDEAKE